MARSIYTIDQNTIITMLNICGCLQWPTAVDSYRPHHLPLALDPLIPGGRQLSEPLIEVSQFLCIVSLCPPLLFYLTSVNIGYDTRDGELGLLQYRLLAVLGRPLLHSAYLDGRHREEKCPWQTHTLSHRTYTAASKGRTLRITCRIPRRAYCGSKTACISAGVGGQASTQRRYQCPLLR